MCHCWCISQMHNMKSIFPLKNQPIWRKNESLEELCFYILYLHLKMRAKITIHKNSFWAVWSSRAVPQLVKFFLGNCNPFVTFFHYRILEMAFLWSGCNECAAHNQQVVGLSQLVDRLVYIPCLCSNKFWNYAPNLVQWCCDNSPILWKKRSR